MLRIAVPSKHPGSYYKLTHRHTHVYHSGTRKLELQVYPPVLILYITKNLHHNIFVKLKMEKLYEAHKLEEKGGNYSTLNKHQM